MISHSARRLSLVTFWSVCLAAIISDTTTLDATQKHTLTNADLEHRHCDSDLCDSIVTKCKRTKRCTCDLKRPQCAKGCLDCLEEKFGRCCGCVKLCRVHVGEYQPATHVGDLNDTQYEELFDTLTETDDIFGRWSIATAPAFKEIHHPELGIIHMRLNENRSVIAAAPQLTTMSAHHDVEDDLSGDQQGSDDLTEHDDVDDSPGAKSTESPQKDQQCVVAFINKQLSMSQCRQYCRSMGASSFRWFHDEACCECVGKSCYHYGIAKPKCQIAWD